MDDMVNKKHSFKNQFFRIVYWLQVLERKYITIFNMHYF